MLFVLLTKRVVKYNTGNTAKFAPRSANREEWSASGPFTAKAVQRAALAALSTHTCLCAQAWSEEQIRDTSRRSFIDHYLSQAIRDGERLLDAVTKKAEVA